MLKKVLIVLLVLSIAALAYAFTGTGRFTGTGSSVTVKVGFKPSHIRMVNQASGVSVEWFEGMSEGAGVKITNSAIEVLSAGGPHLYNGTTHPVSGVMTNAPGFTSGSDANLNNTGDQVSWQAEK